MKATDNGGKENTHDESRIQIDPDTIQNSNSDKRPDANLVRSEVVVNVDKACDESKRNGNKDVLVYECHNQKRVLPITWVYFHQGGMSIPADGGPAFSYTPDRNAFVRLVFLILFIMIASTAFLTSLVYIVPSLMEFFQAKKLFLTIFAVVLMLGLNYTMACSACTRVVPCNIICLVLAVIGMSIFCCVVTVHYDTTIILLAVLATAGIVLLCVALACSSFDFTSWYLYVVMIFGAFAIVSMTIGLYMLITGTYLRTLHLIMLCLGTVLQSVVLVIELQTVLGGKTVELGEDDYALGAFLLYTSIIDIFIKLVQIFGIIDEW